MCQEFDKSLFSLLRIIFFSFLSLSSSLQNGLGQTTTTTTKIQENGNNSEHELEHNMCEQTDKDTPENRIADT